jgi:hypothetical protein
LNPVYVLFQYVKVVCTRAHTGQRVVCPDDPQAGALTASEAAKAISTPGVSATAPVSRSHGA